MGTLNGMLSCLDFILCIEEAIGFGVLPLAGM